MIARPVRLMERISPSVWRRVVVLYWLALTAGTHWPSLRVGRPGPIPVDKILHALAFCGLAGLLMLTRWLDRRAAAAFSARNIHRCTALTLLLAALDEVTQTWGRLDRFARWDDFAADVAGIALAWIVAILLFRPAARHG